MQFETGGDAMPRQVSDAARVVAVQTCRNLHALRTARMRLRGSHHERDRVRLGNEAFEMNSGRIGEQSCCVHTAIYNGLTYFAPKARKIRRPKTLLIFTEIRNLDNPLTACVMRC